MSVDKNTRTLQVAVAEMSIQRAQVDCHGLLRRSSGLMADCHHRTRFSRQHLASSDHSQKNPQGYYLHRFPKGHFVPPLPVFGLNLLPARSHVVSVLKIGFKARPAQSPYP